MDRMSDRLDRHAEWLEMVERLLHDRLARLQTEISALEKQHCDMSDSCILDNMRANLDEFNETAQSEVRHLGKYAVGRTYREGKRPVAMLAGLLRPCLEKDVVLEVQDKQGLPQHTTEPVSD
ncbi:hypothetical protein NDU88_004845 [Pleurodeles waltl]|uniref:Uncharacterized protein n=1 Tax=Pleurodeles waltl TaxID=8319 RepID=A0AAV7PIQ0_PLEWA|nr:hypothetical protein NDU88_004845 [Pleurodeles waltl]